MKNQEKIIDILCDIKVLENNIRARKMALEFYEHKGTMGTLNEADEKTIKRLQKTVNKLKKEDAKIWEESLIVAHGGIQAWWQEKKAIVEYFVIGTFIVTGFILVIYQIIQEISK